MRQNTLRFEKGQWIITASPDVTMHLKRIFPRMEQSVAEELKVKATSEIANDIEWVRLRYPLEVSEDDLKILTREASEHRARLERIRELWKTPPRPTDFQMALPPRSYQVIPARIVHEQGFLLLADEVGLGKTVSAIAAISDARLLPALVVAKTHLTHQWKDEIKKFLPKARTHIIKQSKHYSLPEAEVYVVTFSKLSAWWGHLAKIVYSVIYDEIQELRRPESSKYHAAKMLSGTVDYRIGLSATPISNYGGEIHNVMQLLAPDVLGTEDEFNKHWCRFEGRHWVANDPVALGHYLRNQNLMLRRTRKDVGRELPPIMTYVQDIDFDTKVYEKGLSTADELAKIILSGKFIDRGMAARKFDLQLRQTTGLAKAPFVAEFVRMLVASGEKVLLFGWHRSVYDVWADRLKDLKPAFFTGEESDVQKRKAQLDFIEGRTDILIMSLRSGAGLNGLQNVCSVCVYGEMDWTPAVHIQGTGRLARDGQDASVQEFFLVAPVGSDPVMAGVLGLKKAQAMGVMDLGKDETSGMTETDPKRVKKLAEVYLKSRGIALPPPAPDADDGIS